jgi:hypothetical protein
VFVPASGAFVRFVDVLDNQAAAQVSLPYALGGALYGDAATSWSVADTSSGDTVFGLGDRHAVFTFAGQPAIAAVVAGTGAAPALHDALDWQPYGTNAWWTSRWTALSVPAGGRVLLLQYLLRRPEGQTAEAGAQAEALSALTDPEALVGLTPAEQAAIVNFRP